jgi:hypothetical protein
VNIHEARKVLHVLTAAWPWAEWPEDHLELWMVALQAHEFAAARNAAGRAVRELDRPPSVAWFHQAANAERDRDSTYTAELEAAPVDKEQGKRLAAEARAALHKRMPASLGEAIRQHRKEATDGGVSA